MWSLLLQSLVLLLAAYFVGVWIGCMLRRLIAPPKSRTAMATQTSAQPSASPSPQQPVSAQSADVPDSAGSAAASAPVQQAAAAAAGAAAATVAAAQASPSPTESAPAAAPTRVADRMQSIGTAADPVAARAHIKPEPFPEGRLPAASGGGGETASSVAAVVASPASSAPERPPTQDLTAIRGIDAATAVVLEREGVTRYEQLSAWNEGDVARINRALGGMRRVQEENWIEQAKILATGGMTAFARRRKANAAAGAPSAPHIVSPSPDQGNVVSLAAPAAAAVPVAAATSSRETNSNSPINGGVSVDVSGDDLTAIQGITPEIASMLKEQGISRFAQLARLDTPAANRLNGLLGVDQRVQRERWVEQAATQVGLPDSGSTGSTPVSMLSASEMAASAAAATVVSSSSVAVQSIDSGVMQPANSNAADVKDNLRRIRGIGELIERKLQGLGVTTYSAIADWTEQDVRRVSEVLDFRGRIERENWIEQARILASGGQTEFSRRFDTGD